MEPTQENIANYLRPFVRHPHPLLAILEADAATRGVPIIGPWVGQVLALLARSIEARQMLELGTATGYSAIWLAMATADWDGRVTTIDQDATRVREAQQNVNNAGLSECIRIVRSTALPALQDLPGPFDLIFNDILWYLRDTDEAQQLCRACVERLSPGGLLLCDNALRGGSVMDASPDAAAQATQAFTESLLRDPQMDTTVLPIRDGLLICRMRNAE